MKQKKRYLTYLNYSLSEFKVSLGVFFYTIIIGLKKRVIVFGEFVGLDFLSFLKYINLLVIICIYKVSFFIIKEFIKILFLLQYFLVYFILKIFSLCIKIKLILKNIFKLKKKIVVIKYYISIQN
jgi:hypothetical protein